MCEIDDIRKEMPDVKLCIKLKELGYNQYGISAYWAKVDGEWRIIFPAEKFADFWEKATRIIKIPHPYEIKELLPYKLNLGNNIYAYLVYKKTKNKIYIIEYIKHSSIKNSKDKIIKSIKDRKKINCKIKMIIWLIKNGYIKFNKKEV